tara:strand:- start:1324 stop:1473 length:150 start_codon:yes stop_codon:yes gene_type:complete
MPLPIRFLPCEREYIAPKTPSQEQDSTFIMAKGKMSLTDFTAFLKIGFG